MHARGLLLSPYPAIERSPSAGLFVCFLAESRNFWSVYRESEGHFRRIIWTGERNGPCRSGNVLRARNSRLLGSFARTTSLLRASYARASLRDRMLAARTRRRRNDWTISATLEYYDYGPSKSERSRPSYIRRSVKTGWPDISLLARSSIRRLVSRLGWTSAVNAIIRT